MAVAAIMVLAALLASPHLAAADLVIVNAERTVDVTSQKVVVKASMQVKNEGRTAAKEIIVCEPAALHAHRAVGQVAQVVDKKMLPLEGLAPAPGAGAPAGVVCEAAPLKAPLAPGATAEITLAAVYTGVQVPKPKEIRQKDLQRVVYSADSATLLSPYTVRTQALSIKLPATKAESFTDVHPARSATKSVEYGPYLDTAPFTSKPIAVHYGNNSPFATARRVDREVEVSHWGNAYFEERYHVAHTGAKLVGEWSRLDYQTNPGASQSAIKDFTAAVPHNAASLYFRDEIGNISSSEVQRHVRAAYAKLTPRFPLFGGWSTRFLFGWSVPLADVVTKAAKGKVALTMTVGPSIGSLVTEELVVRVALPEGATDVEVDCKLDMTRTLAKKYTYLDVLGRTVVVLEGRNFVPEMDAALTVTYRYSSMALLQKPLILVAAFAAIFAAIVACSGGGSGPSKSAAAAAAALAKAHAE